MPRFLGEERRCLKVRDPLSGSVVTLYYRRPTTEERVAYQLSVFCLEGGERRLRLAETRLKFGLAILEGFEPGDFQVQEEGRRVPLDPERHPDWKERLREFAPELPAFLAQQVFEGLRVVDRGGEEWG